MEKSRDKSTVDIPIIARVSYSKFDGLVMTVCLFVVCSLCVSFLFVCTSRPVLPLVSFYSACISVNISHRLCLWELDWFADWLIY